MSSHTASDSVPAAGASATSAGPAVSARILKKRETDRKCQRMIRERTKSRIAYLEGLVEQFREQDPSGRVETLMNQLAQVKEERDGLVKKVKTIEGIIAGGKLKDESEIHDTAQVKVRSNSFEDISPSVPFQESVEDSGSQSPLDQSPPMATEAPSYVIHNKEYAAYLESATQGAWPTPAMQPHQHPVTPCECSTYMSSTGSAKALNKWRYANDTLTAWFKWPHPALSMQEYAAYNEDVPIRAMVEGWDAVERHGHMHPAWQLLRGIDETIFRYCEQRERLAVMIVMSYLLLAHISPSLEQRKKVPSFYLKRPSTGSLHSYASEYFAWPGLRERFVYSEHRYCSNSFWKYFCRNLRIAWPYEFRDCYTRNLDTGLYEISPSFQERIGDIRSWTMGIEMFKQWPELYSDIPAWNHIPTSLSFMFATSHHDTQAALPPPTYEASETNEKLETPARRDSHNQGVDQVQMPRSVSMVDPSVHHISQQYVVYGSSLGSSDVGSTPISASFEFPSSNIIPALPTEEQHVASMGGWEFNGNMHMFLSNPA